MKKTIQLAILLAGLALTANAQQTAGGGGGGTPMIDKKIEEYKTVTGASDEQLAKIRPILEAERKAKKAAKELPAAEQDPKLKEIYKNTAQEVGKILTPEQKEKWKAHKAAAKKE